MKVLSIVRLANGSRAVPCQSDRHAVLSAAFHMPTYEYICEKCDHQFDVFQSIKDKPLTVCPEAKCKFKKWGKGKVKKMIGSGAGLIFKGSGFYITDYRSESYKEAAKKDAAPASGDSGKSGDAKSKSEAAPKTESKPKAEPKTKSSKT